VVWSVPNYFAALPSWYNLFFAVFGTWTLVKYDETRARIWLVAAGVCAGISFLFKLAGLFFVAAALLFLVYREQDLRREASPRGTQPPHVRGPIGARAFSLFSTGALVAFVLALVMLIRDRPTSAGLLHFVLPGAALSGYLVVSEWRLRAGDSGARFVSLLGSVGAIALGLATPIALFLVPYALNSGLAAFFHGVFVLPYERLQWASYPLPPVSSLVAMLPWLLLLAIPLVTRRWLARGARALHCRSPLLAAALAVVCVAGIAYGGSDPVYRAVWSTTRPLVPLAVLIGVTMLFREHRETRPGQRVLFLFSATAAMVSLVQFPYAFGIYFCYAAPTVVLALAAVVGMQARSPRVLHCLTLLFYMGFAVLWLNDGDVRSIGVRHADAGAEARLGNPRSGLRVSGFSAALYQELVAEIHRHTVHGDYIYVTADAPEVYFLAGRRNPTRTFYDFFDSDFAGDTSARTERIMRTLESHGFASWCSNGLVSSLGRRRASSLLRLPVAIRTCAISPGGLRRSWHP
jgi:hypothetical protein